MQISEFSVKRPITVLMIMLSIVVLGLISLKRLPLTFLPEVSSSRLNIFVPYRSSSPEEVERLITVHIEDIVSTVSRLKSITSTSSATGASVTVEFEDGTDMDLAAMEVRNRLDLVWAYLPDDVERIFIRRWQSTDMPVINFTVSWNGSGGQFNDLVRYQLLPRIQRIEGVANVDLRGLEEKSVIVELDQDLMRAYGVDPFNLMQSIRSNNLNLSAGFVYDGGRKFSVRTIGEYRSVEEIARTPIRGTNLYLKDIATIRFGIPEKKRYQRLNGKDAISFVVYKAFNANVVDVCNRVKAVLKEIQQEPRFRDLNIQIYRDQSREIVSSLRNLRDAGLVGAVLAVLVLFVFLRKVRSTLIIATAIPIAILFAFLVMYLLRLRPIESQITLNLISMMGMVYAIGMLVDPSIVVLENIFRHKQEEGLNARDAAIVGSREVGMAILAATLTTMIVFMPLIMLQGGFMSRMMYDFGIVICTILFSSMAIAITLVPLMASRIFTGKERQKARELVWLQNTYARVIRWTLRHRLLTVAGAVAIFLFSYYLSTKIDREFQPPAPSRRLDFRVDLPGSYTLEQMNQLFGEIEKKLLARKDAWDIQAVSTDFGVGRSSRGGRGRLTVFLKEQPQTGLTTMAILDSIRSILPSLPGVRFRFGGMHHMSGQRSGINIQLKGESPEVLELLAEEVVARISDIPGIRDIETSYEEGQEEVQIVMNRERVNRHGLSSQRVARSVQSALTERAASKFKTRDREVDILINLKEEDRTSLEKLRNLAVQSPQSEPVPLYTLAEMQVARGPESIQRESRRRTLSIQASLYRRGMATSTREVQKRLADLKLPPGYSWEFGSNWRRWRESEAMSMFSILLALLLILMIMASLFESLIHPFTIITSVGFALIGVFLIFWITGTNLSSVAYLGILVVCGLVVNNGIILVDHINQLRRKGLTRHDAIVKGGMDRIRPILMTAATTNLGLLPMIVPLFFPSIFGPIEGRAGMWAPVGLAVFGGLTTSTFLTLVILPTIYSLMDDLKIGILRVMRRAG